MAKQQIKDQLSFSPAPVNPDLYNDERRVIPDDALFAVFGTEHLEIKKFKEELIAKVRKTTFSNADRFLKPKLNYTQECADRSRIDADRM